MTQSVAEVWSHDSRQVIRDVVELVKKAEMQVRQSEVVAPSQEEHRGSHCWQRRVLSVTVGGREEVREERDVEK